MAEAACTKSKYGLRRNSCQAFVELRRNKDKVEKQIVEVLSSFDAKEKNDSSNLWASAIKVKYERHNSEIDLKKGEGSKSSSKLSYKPNIQSKNYVICYELKKEHNFNENKICGWPQCSCYHPCRDSDPAALLDGNYFISKKTASKPIASRSRSARDDKTTRHRELCSGRIDRPLSLMKKSASRDGDFAHVVPPPPAPIPFTFEHRDDVMQYATDYRLQYTYSKLQSLQKIAKSRPVLQRTKIVSIDSRTFTKSTIRSQKLTSPSAFKQDLTFESSFKLKSPDSDLDSTENHKKFISRRSSSCMPKTVKKAPLVGRKSIGEVDNLNSSFFSGQPDVLSSCVNRNVLGRKSEVTRTATSTSVPDPGKNVKHSNFESFSVANKQVYGKVLNSCSTWPQNSMSRKNENNHRNSLVVQQQQKSFNSILSCTSIKPRAVVSLPSSPKKMSSLKCNKTFTPPIARRKKFIELQQIFFSMATPVLTQTLP